MNIAITTNDSDPNQSTFIDAQRELVKDVKCFLYGDLLPLNEYEIGYIGRQSFWQKNINRFLKGDYKKQAFVKFLKRNKIELILAQYGVSAAALVDICKDNNIKLIPHFHGFDAYEYNILKKFQNRYQKVFEYSSYLIAVSKAMKKQLIKLGAPEDKIIVNPCAPNDNFYNVKPDYSSNKVITSGRFVDKKAPYLAVLAFAGAKKQSPELELVMIGDGPLMNTTMNLIKYLGLSDSIHLKGELKRQEIIKEMNGAFCYVQHSITAKNGDSEGTPVAIMEAGAAGLPIVSTRHAGIPDVAIEGKSAILVDEQDVKGMTDGIIQLAKDRDLAKSMGENGRIYTKQHLSMKKYIDTLDRYIAKAISNK